MNRLFMIMAVLLAAGCRGPSVTQEHVVADAFYNRVSVSARAAFQRGDIPRAEELYEQALDRARAMDRASEIGLAAYHLAICRIALGEAVDGLALLREADRALERTGEDRVPVWIAEAEAARSIGDRTTASTRLDQALQALDRRREQAWRAQIHVLQALIAIDETRWAEAEAALASAETSVRRDTPPRLLARIAEVQGRILLQAGEMREAAAAFDREADLYRDAARFADMTRARSRAAQAFARAGEHAEAADRFYRAARSFHSLDLPDAALRQVEQALVSLEQVEEAEDLAARVAQLVQDLSDSLTPPDRLSDGM